MHVASVSTADLVSLLIALAAFAVSIASLYLTSLRRPKVRVEQFHRKSVLRLLDAGDENDPPRAEAEVPVFVINTGASPTVVFFDHEGVQAGMAGELCSRAELVADFGSPVVVEKDNAREGSLRLVLSFAFDFNRSESQPDRTRFAEQLGDAQPLTFTLTWQYSTTRFPRLWERTWDTKGRLPVEVNFDCLRSELIEQWDLQPSMALYAMALERRTAEPETVDGEVVTNEDDDDESCESH